MTTLVESTCSCGSIGRSDLRQCPEHFKLWRGDVRLTSVSRIVRLWPQKPCNACGSISYDGHCEDCPVFAKILNAQERGKEVDTLLTAWLRGKLQRIPAGSVRQDSAALFNKLVAWFKQKNFKDIDSQVLIADNKIGGVVDLMIDGQLIDLKSVYSLADTHRLQVAGYCAISGNVPGALLHVTERYAEPRLIPLDHGDYMDWFIVRDFWELTKRRGVSEVGHD